jgi:hypothetical protein
MPSIDGDAFGVPLAKRQKRDPEQTNVSPKIQKPGSRIFSPFRVSYAGSYFRYNAFSVAGLANV